MSRWLLTGLGILLLAVLAWVIWGGDDTQPRAGKVSAGARSASPGSGALDAGGPTLAPGAQESAGGDTDDLGPLRNCVPEDVPGRWREAVDVRVVAVEGDVPIEGATVRVRYEHPEYTPADEPEAPLGHEGRTDAEGRVAVPYPAASYGAAWLVRKRGYVTARPEVRRGAEPFVVRMTPAPPLGIRVVEAGSGRPLDGVRVRAQPVEAPWDAIDEERVSDARGLLELRGVPAGAPIEITAATDGFGTLVARHVPVDGAGAPFEIELGGGAEIVGVVRDAQGEPAAGAEVFVAPLHAATPLRSGDRWDEPARAFRRTCAVADDTGQFRVRGIPASGTYRVHARSREHAEGVSEAVAVPAVGGRHEVVVTVRRLGSVTIHYVDAESRDAIDPADVRCSMDAAWGEQRADQVPTWDSDAMVACLRDVPPGMHVCPSPAPCTARSSTRAGAR